MNITLFKPDKKNLNSFMAIGGFLILIGFIDIIVNSFFSINITQFLPGKISYLSPLILGLFGLYLIRIEFSGNKLLDKINTNFNSSNFNAFLMLILQEILKMIVQEVALAGFS